MRTWPTPVQIQKLWKEQITVGNRLQEFVIVADSGYSELRHFPFEDSEGGCFIQDLVAGDNMDEIITKALNHDCEARKQNAR